MIYINCPVKQDFVIDVLEKSSEGVQFKYIKKEGIKLYFEVDTEDLELAITLAKKIIKATPVGSVLYFQVLK